MKKVVLIFTFLLTVSISFAANDAKIVSIDSETIELINSMELEPVITIEETETSCTVTYTNSSGVTFSSIAETSCTVTYTNSSGVTFSSTAETCTEAYENLSMHIEARAK